MMEVRLEYLRPGQVIDRLKEFPVVYIPVGPVEWHGPHNPLGVDPLNAQTVARTACHISGGVVWPTLFWGTDRKRPPEQLEGLGLPPDAHIVGMDFPDNTLPSMYCQEEIFAIIIRTVLSQCMRLGTRVAAIVNGHGGRNQIPVLDRLRAEFNNETALRVYHRMASTRKSVDESITGGHASAIETSKAMNFAPDSVDLSQLPPHPEPLPYAKFAMVDSNGMAGNNPTKALPECADPRTKASADLGKRISDKSAQEIVEDVREIVATL